LRPSCSPKTRRGGSRRISPSCRSCCGSLDSEERGGRRRVFQEAGRLQVSSGPAAPVAPTNRQFGPLPDEGRRHADPTFWVAVPIKRSCRS
jgi:hypothetical protein